MKNEFHVILTIKKGLCYMSRHYFRELIYDGNKFVIIVIFVISK